MSWAASSTFPSKGQRHDHARPPPSANTFADATDQDALVVVAVLAKVSTGGAPGGSAAASILHTACRTRKRPPLPLRIRLICVYYRIPVGNILMIMSYTGTESTG